MDRYTRTYENGDITTTVRFSPCGYGRNAEVMYDKSITVYSIADGIIKAAEIPCNQFYR